jgi:hypothetical protein
VSEDRLVTDGASIFHPAMSDGGQADGERPAVTDQRFDLIQLVALSRPLADQHGQDPIDALQLGSGNERPPESNEPRREAVL